MSDYFYNLKMRRPFQKMMQKLEPITYYRNYLDYIKKFFNGKTQNSKLKKMEKLFATRQRVTMEKGCQVNKKKTKTAKESRQKTQTGNSQRIRKWLITCEKLFNFTSNPKKIKEK